ncbi:phosphotransferase [Intrasporangium sp. YIM S08009]|uniref:phosphotransferase n=1 Tax=Intrasporangium zincisolvens TaxID=3080018 RepID=UPI002B054AA8|nr:phosphotransferase [Intrasporangium sp. YIM S08009]
MTEASDTTDRPDASGSAGSAGSAAPTTGRDDPGDERVRDLVAETLGVAGRLLGADLEPVGDAFPGSRRTLVMRARDASGGSVVVKRYLTEEPEAPYAREASALAVLSTVPGAPAPRLLAESADPRVVVLSDLGDAPHLASRLLGLDPVAAAGSLADWAEGLGHLHVAGRGLQDAFVDGVRARAGEELVVDYTPAHLDEAAGEWSRLARALGVDVPDAAWDVLRQVPDRFRVDASSLSAADMCPDNNLLTDDGVRLLDFEFALWRPVAWDVAYLHVPWPTCWCAWSLEVSAARAALERWRGVAAQAWPGVATADFDDDLALAREAWAWLAGSWCVAELVDGRDRTPNPVKPMPRMPDRSLRFLRSAADGVALPELADVARRLADAVARAHGAVEVPLAPAFAGAPS